MPCALMWNGWRLLSKGTRSRRQISSSSSTAWTRLMPSPPSWTRSVRHGSEGTGRPLSRVRSGSGMTQRSHGSTITESRCGRRSLILLLRSWRRPSALTPSWSKDPVPGDTGRLRPWGRTPPGFRWRFFLWRSALRWISPSSSPGDWGRRPRSPQRYGGRGSVQRRVGVLSSWRMRPEPRRLTGTSRQM